jgi:hypothetical protein
MRKRNMEKSKTSHHRNMRMALFSFLIVIKAMVFGQGSISVHVKDSLKKEDSIIMSKVVQMPEFPGGEGELMSYIWKRIKLMDFDDSIIDYSSTRIVLRFVVNEDGTVSDIYVYKSIAPKFDTQIIGIIKSMPGFNPGLGIDHKPIRAVMILPLQLEFRLK